jgi:hypothetical protein
MHLYVYYHKIQEMNAVWNLCLYVDMFHFWIYLTMKFVIESLHWKWLDVFNFSLCLSSIIFNF